MPGFWAFLALLEKQTLSDLGSIAFLLKPLARKEPVTCPLIRPRFCPHHIYHGTKMIFDKEKYPRCQQPAEKEPPSRNDLRRELEQAIVSMVPSKELLIYLAAPYSHDDPLVIAQRMRVIDQYTAELIRSGYKVFSPLSYGHYLARRYDLPTGYESWVGFNDSMLMACQYMLILRLPGWEDSKGLAREIAIAQKLEMPGEFIDPDPTNYEVEVKPDFSGAYVEGRDSTSPWRARFSTNDYEVLGAS